MAIIGNLLYHSLESTHIATASFLLLLCCGTHYLLQWWCHHHHWRLSKLTWQQLICCLFLLFKFSIIIRTCTRSVLSSFYALVIHVVLVYIAFSFTSRLRRGGAPLYDNAQASPVQYWKRNLVSLQSLSSIRDRKTVVVVCFWSYYW